MARDLEKISREEIYKQLCEEFRSLNGIFWQIPTIAMTLNGGVGLALGSVKLTPSMQTALLVFVAICNFSFIAILWRLRMQVMEEILDRIRELEHRPKRHARFHIMFVFMFLLAVAGTFSLAAICYRDTLLPQAERTDYQFMIQH
jgi:hypothetical protein